MLRIRTTGTPHVTPRGSSASFISPSDGGTTWSKPTVVSAQQTAAGTGGGLPEVAIDASTGHLYVVWEDARFTSGTVNQAAISTSTNGGATWSAPFAVSKITGRPAFTPAVAVNSAGTVAVTYYDVRNLAQGNTKTLPTDYWFTSSSDHGATSGNETHIAGSFDMLNAPNAGGFFVPDEEALTTIGTTFEPFFVQTNNGNTSNRTDVFTTFV